MQADTVPTQWPEQAVLKQIAERLLRAWGRPIEWSDDISQEVWLALKSLDGSPERVSAIVSREFYAIKVLRSTTIRWIRKETRAESELPSAIEDLRLDLASSEEAATRIVKVAREELERLDESATPKRRRCGRLIRAMFELHIQHFETTGERLPFSEAYRILSRVREMPLSEKALRYHYDNFTNTVLGTVLPKKECKR